MESARVVLHRLLLVGVVVLIMLGAAAASTTALAANPSNFEDVPRGQMAVQISCALGLTGSRAAGQTFADVPPTHVFAPEVDRCAAAGITQGCSSDHYCPERRVTRAAAFLARALDALTYSRFLDVPSHHTFAAEINRLGEAEMTRGCAVGHDCPRKGVSRTETAALLRRVLESPAASGPRTPDTEPEAPAPTSPTPPDTEPEAPAPTSPTPDTEPEAPAPTSPTPDTEPEEGPDEVPSERVEQVQGLGSYGALPNGEARYPVPPAAVFVAPGGSDGGDGSASAPLATVSEAIRRAPVDGTIVLRGGSYHQRFTLTKRLTIQNYPGEEVWFDGSRQVSSWRASGGAWIHDGWDIQFDASPTYTWGAAPNTSPGWSFVNPDYPMAAHPDQVWVDGMPQRQVGSRSEVTDGAFYVDYAAEQLVLGTNPAGRHVRASAIARAIEIRADGAVLRGFGVRRYAPSIPHMGTITAERPGIALENLHITDNATTGLALLAADQRAVGITALRNGMLGVVATYADRLSVDHLRSASNNLERFNMAPVAGGMKIGRSRGVSITNSRFDGNLGTGLWIDESVHDARVANSVLAGNRGHGLSLEISAKMMVANNLIRDNRRFGIKVNNTSDVAIWNNTILDNDRPINIVQDGRRLTSSTSPGRDPRQPFPDPTMTWINGPVAVHNNVVSGTTGNCLVCVEDYSGEFSAEAMGVTTNGNVYSRMSVAAPRWFAVWSRGPGNPAVFNSLDEFRAATGQENSSLAFDGVALVTADGRLEPDLGISASSVSLPLPTEVAQVIEQPAGSRHLGAYLGE